MNLLTAVACLAAAFLSASLFSHTVALRLTLLLVGTTLAAVAAWRNRSDIRALPPIWLPFLLWAAWAALSVVWSVEPERTLKELRNEIWYAALALWMCFVGAQAAHAWRIFMPLVGASAAAVIAIALREFSIGPERYLTGLHGGPGHHSSALLTLMPCVLMTAWYGWRAGWSLRAQLPSWMMALLILVSAYFTLNRTVWVGLALQFFLVCVFVLLRHRASAGPPKAARARLAVGALVVAIVAGTAIALSAVQAKRGGGSLMQDTRFALWPEIVERIGERPFTGYGFGRGLLRAPLQAEFRELDAFLWHAHNIFLEALLQLGVPGLALLLLLLGAILRAGWRAARDASDLRAACGMALIAVVAGMLVRNMTDTLFVRQNALLFWGVVGVLLAWSIPVYSGTQRRSCSRTATGRVSPGAASQASSSSTNSWTSGARARATLSLGCGVGKVFSASARGSS
jgi:O-antigen ligase